MPRIMIFSTSLQSTRLPQASYSSHLKVNGSFCAPSYTTTLVKGNWEDNSYTQRVGSGFAAQNGQIFSLPRSRLINFVKLSPYSDLWLSVLLLFHCYSKKSTFQTSLWKLSAFGTTGSTFPGAYLLFEDSVGHLIKELLWNRVTR